MGFDWEAVDRADPMAIRIVCTGTINGGQPCPGTAAYTFRCPRGGRTDYLCHGHGNAMLRVHAPGKCATCGEVGTLPALLEGHYVLERF